MELIDFKEPYKQHLTDIVFELNKLKFVTDFNISFQDYFVGVGLYIYSSNILSSNEELEVQTVLKGWVLVVRDKIIVKSDMYSYLYKMRYDKIFSEIRAINLKQLI